MATQGHNEIRSEIHFVIPPVEISSIPLPTRGEPRPKPAAKATKKLVRRADRDRSQIMRRSFQSGFLLLNLWIGGIFYFWVRQFEPGGAPTSLHRPAGVEGWLPISADCVSCHVVSVPQVQRFPHAVERRRPRHPHPERS